MKFLQRLQRFRLFRVDCSSSFEQFYRDSIVDIERFNARIGFNMFNPTVNLLNVRFIWSVLMLVSNFYFMPETAYFFRDDISKVMMCVVTLGFLFQMASKIYTFIVIRKKLLVIHDMNLEYFGSEYTRDFDVQEALLNNTMLTKFILKMISSLFPSLSMTLMFTPAVYSLVTSNLLLPYGFEISHTGTWTAYAINWIYQAICSFCLVMVTVSSESAFVLLLLTACGQIDTLVVMIGQLGAKVNAGKSEQEIYLQLKRIVKLHQHHQLYVEKMKDLFEFYFLIAIASLCSVMTMSMAALVLVNWYLGVVMSGFSSFQILFGCVLGTHWQMKNEELMTKIMTFDWYKLSIKNQKAILLILKASQSYTDMSALILPLNVESYVEIHKKVYSMIMVLVNVKE